MTGRRFFLAIVLLCAAVTFAGDGAAESRIVSIGGSTTEIVYRLGLGDRIIAVDTTSLYPAAVGAKPNIGYMRSLSAEPIIALRPSIVLADADAGPAASLAQLREAGLKVVTVPAEPSIDGVFRKIDVIARALDRTAAGEALARAIRSRLDRVRAAVSRVKTRPRVLFLLSVGSGGAPMGGGRNSSADGIIGLAGGVNAADGFEGYKPISPEAIITAAPDIVLVTQRTLQLLGGREKLLALPAIAATPAGKAERIVSMDGLLLLGFGPRIGDAIGILARLLHPDAAVDRSLGRGG